MDGAGAKASRLLWRKLSPFPGAMGLPADASGAYRPDPQATTKLAPRPSSLKGYHSGQAERDPESRFLSDSGFRRLPRTRSGVRRIDGVSDFCKSLEEKLIRFPSLLPSFLSFAIRSAPGTILLPFPPYAFRHAPHGIWSFSHAPGP